MNRITSQLGSQLSLVSLDGTRRPAPPALVLVGHGSRDPRALSTVRALLDRIRDLRPGLPVHLGHIELNEPLLPDTLAGLGTGDAVLVPLLLSRGYHVKQDIPEAAAAARAHTRVAAPLGPHPLLVETLYERLTEAGWRAPRDEAERRASGVVLAAAGSRDPDAAVDTRRTASLLAGRLGVPVVPGVRLRRGPHRPRSRTRPHRPRPPPRRRRLLLHGPRPLLHRVRGGSPLDRGGPPGRPPVNGPPDPAPLRPGAGDRDHRDTSPGLGVSAPLGPGCRLRVRRGLSRSSPRP